MAVLEHSEFYWYLPLAKADRSEQPVEKGLSGSWRKCPGNAGEQMNSVWQYPPDF